MCFNAPKGCGTYLELIYGKYIPWCKRDDVDGREEKRKYLPAQSQCAVGQKLAQNRMRLCARALFLLPHYHPHPLSLIRAYLPLNYAPNIPFWGIKIIQNKKNYKNNLSKFQQRRTPPQYPIPLHKYNTILFKKVKQWNGFFSDK